ncbi:unnamed protein product [Thelazia callipaeda]|uniref:IRS-type PTB domain-containing protein n=1 Tax=Thelazia callipaeda TaxID=103827 RepID=A0A158RC84_THECL|nr:unnamed protein product [Thelazia callipaeda]
MYAGFFDQKLKKMMCFICFSGRAKRADKPEKEGYHSRHEASSQCSPLSLPSAITENCLSKSPLLQCRSVHPQIDFTPVQQSINKIVIESKASIEEQNRPSIYFKPLPKITTSEVIDCTFEEDAQTCDFQKSVQIPAVATATRSNYLRVDDPLQRTRSVEMILPAANDEEQQCASFELCQKTGQYHRLLPDTDYLQKVCFVPDKHHCMEFR